MLIRFKQLKLHNFKSHRSLTIDFGNITRISGDNAKGKSSIGEGPTFILFGTDMMGTKLDPTPIGYEFDRVHAELLLQVDDKQLLLARGIEKGKNTFYINEVPSKATEFDELVKSLFDEDLFLSLYNPSYFPSLKWDEQRALILRYVSVPAKQEVFKHMIPAQAEKLAELTKKHSLEKLDQIHRDNKNRKDKEYTFAQGKTKALTDQLASIKTDTFDPETAKKHIVELDGLIAAHNASYAETATFDVKLQQLRKRYDRMKDDLISIREQYDDAKAQKPEDTCSWCGQTLPEEAKAEAIKAHERHCKGIADRYNKLLAEAKEVKAQLDSLINNTPTEEEPDISALHEEKANLQRLLREHETKVQLQQQIEAAKQAEAETLKSRNDSIFVIDAIKEYHAKSAELQAAKVQSLFTTLSLRLFKENKGDGEIKPDFELMYDGRPYRKLSLSESIRAGLELRDVLSGQSGIVAPVFVDNQESVTSFKSPIGQLIVSRVVAGQELKIESEEAQ
jgi:hypothetical protein